MISMLKKIILRFPFLRIPIRYMRNFLKNLRYVARGFSCKVDNKTFVFSAYNGRGYVCSPKAVYEYMQNDPRFADCHYVWLFDHPENYLFLEDNINTRVLKNQSKACEKALHTAKYWIFNFRALDHWIPKKEQCYVQCWHGTPLKRLGYDIGASDNAMNSVKEIRDKYCIDTKRFDYLLSPCRFVTETFTSAWNLKQFGKENVILETGYPRNDFLNTFTEQDVDAVKMKLGLQDCKKKIILYAPTWRDNQHDTSKGYTYDNPVDFQLLKKHLQDDYIILFRAHYLVADSFAFDEYAGFVYDVSAVDDINDLYIISDVLITDYSSVFFDYGILRRPMVFYMYDMEAYRDEIRGFYLDVSTLPGPIVKTEQELIETLSQLSVDESYMNALNAFNKEYNLLNDGKAAERLVNHIVQMET